VVETVEEDVSAFEQTFLVFFQGDWMRHRHVFGSRGSGGVIVLLRSPRSRKNASHSSGRG
jgi:hypothetical protein